MEPVDSLLSKEDFSETAHKERVLFLNRNNLIPPTIWVAHKAETVAQMSVMGWDQCALFHYGTPFTEYSVSTLIYAHPWKLSDFPYMHGMGIGRSKEERLAALWEAVAFLHWLHTTYHVTDYKDAARLAIYKFMEPELFDMVWRAARNPKVAHTVLMTHIKLLMQRDNVA